MNNQIVPHFLDDPDWEIESGDDDNTWPRFAILIVAVILAIFVYRWANVEPPVVHFYPPPPPNFIVVNGVGAYRMECSIGATPGRITLEEVPQ